MTLKPWITLQDKLQYKFKLPNLLIEALTHKSYAHETSTSKELFAHNERLEFLGDAVLDLGISSLLMHRDFSATEGQLSKRRAALVNEVTLAEVALEMEIQDYLILGKGELCSKGGEKPSILSSAFEAVLGAVYIDGGFEEVLKIIERLFIGRIQNLKTDTPFAKDYKTRLQELIQSRHKMAPQYVVEKTEGPEHLKTFQVAVIIKNNRLATGTGRSRKEAEQNAAQKALEEMPDA